MMNKKIKFIKKESVRKQKIMRKVNYKECGITLVALVITIIILLILTGVTLTTALSQNGLFKRAKTTVEKYNLESEREYLGQNVISVQLGKYLENVSSERLGDELKEKNIENSYNWHIVKVENTGKQYDNGWYYVEKGTELSGYGNANYNWLVNYETGEIIQLEEGKYKSWSAGDMLAVKDNLIINIDSSIIDKGTGQSKEDIEKQLGTGVELHNFSEEGTNESGLTSTSFNFDGVDDYITIQYDKQEQKEALSKQGFTFEFYGSWNLGNNYWISNNEKFNGYCNGLFYYGIKDSNEWSWFRFGIVHNNGNASNPGIEWSVNGGYKQCRELSDYCHKSYQWNVVNSLSETEFEPNKPCYITITLDTSKSQNKNSENGVYSDGSSFNKSGEFYSYKCYINGKKVYDADFNKVQWDIFTNELLNSFNCFTIGRINEEYENYAWNYSKLNCYALRLYSKGLSEKEVEANYKKSTEYHALLESN